MYPFIIKSSMAVRLPLRKSLAGVPLSRTWQLSLIRPRPADTAMPKGVVYSGSSRVSVSEQTVFLKWPPAMATRLRSISSASATFSCSVGSLLPPPARNTAEGADPLRASTRWAISLASSSTVGVRAVSTSSTVQLCSSPRILVN